MGAELGVPIKVAVNRTGITAHVIRIWERRHGAVTPRRSDTNRRLYTSADIQRLRLLRRATELGHSIGHIARLSAQELENLLKADEKVDKSEGLQTSAPIKVAAINHNSGDTRTPELQETAAGFVSRGISAAHNLDALALESIIAEASVKFGQMSLMDYVIHPLMDQIGVMWQYGSLRVANEHLATAVVRSFLGSLRNAYRIPNSAPGVIFTTPAGQMHELGALMAATVAAASGWRTTYLGPDLPAEEIASAVDKTTVQAVALSLTYPSDDPHLGPELSKLRQRLPAEFPILVGGRSATRYKVCLEDVGAELIATTLDLTTYLDSNPA